MSIYALPPAHVRDMQLSTPLDGRANTMQHAEQDVKLLKSANLNYLRASHYPPTMELVEAADRHGMYLDVEAPFCWVGVEEDLSHLREVLVPGAAIGCGSSLHFARR